MGTELCCLALQMEKAHGTRRVWHAKVALQIVLATGNGREVAQQRAQPTHLHEARSVELEGWGLCC